MRKLRVAVMLKRLLVSSLSMLFFSCSEGPPPIHEYPFKVASSDLLPLVEYVDVDKAVQEENAIRLSYNFEYRTNLQRWINLLAPQLKKRSVLKEIVQYQVIDSHHIDTLQDEGKKTEALNLLKTLNEMEFNFISIDNSDEQNMQSAENYTVVSAYYTIRTAFNSRGVNVPVVPLPMLMDMRSKQTRYMRHGKILNELLKTYTQTATSLLDLLQIEYRERLEQIDLLFERLQSIDHQPQCKDFCTIPKPSQLNDLIHLTDGREYLFNIYYFSRLAKLEQNKLNREETSSTIRFMSEDIIGVLDVERSNTLNKVFRIDQLQPLLKKQITQIYIESRIISAFYKEKLLADQKYNLVFGNKDPLEVLSPNDTINFRIWINEVSDDHVIFIRDWVSIITNQKLLFDQNAGKLQYALAQYFALLDKFALAQENMETRDLSELDINHLNFNFNEVHILLLEVRKRLRVYNSYLYELIGMSTKEFNFLI